MLLTVGLLVAVRCAAGAELGEWLSGPVQTVVGDCQFTEGPARHPHASLRFGEVPNSRFARRGADDDSLYAMSQPVLVALSAQLAGAAPASSTPTGEQSSDTAEGATTFESGDLKLKIPARWKQGKPTNRLRLAQFEIPAAEGDTEPGELVVSGPFGGSDAQNIERWIGQFDAEGRTAATSKGTGALGEYVVVELSGTYKRPIGPPIQGRTEPAPGYRMLGAILKLKEGNYFLKLTGPDKTIAAAADEFRSTFGGEKAKESEVAE